MKLKVPCEEANHICDKSQYHEASFWEKLKLNIHLLYCRVCREYTANNQKLSKEIKKAKVQSCPKESKELFQEQIRQELKK